VKKNILISGLPGVGKTTIVMRLAEILRPFCPVGFYTSEIREGGTRKGFELVSLDGKKQVFSHIGIKSRFRVGRYGVDIDAFDEFLDTVDLLGNVNRLIIIDEIGKMECLSGKFKDLVVRVLDSDKPVIAVIALKGVEIIRTIKNRADVETFEVTPRNREALVAEILAALKDFV
jgi:nucleoside-triphosphatase